MKDTKIAAEFQALIGGKFAALLTAPLEHRQRKGWGTISLKLFRVK